MFKKIKRNFSLALISARPTTWIRVFAEILLGFAFAKQQYIFSDYINLFLGFICIGPLLWSAAYILNDISDRTYDSQHNLKKKRPIASGIFSVNIALTTAGILTTAALFLASTINSIFFIGTILLICTQILYTLPPFRFKERFFIDIAINSINAGIRFVLGYATANTSFTDFPFVFLFFVIFLKAFLFLGHRFQSKQIEMRNHFKSTIAILPTGIIKIMLFFLLLLTGVFYYLSIFLYNLGAMMFIIPIVVLTFSLPLIIRIKRDALLSEEKNIHNRIYLYCSLFLFSLLIFFFKS